MNHVVNVLAFGTRPRCSLAGLRVKGNGLKNNCLVNHLTEAAMRKPETLSYYRATAHSAPERPRLQGAVAADVCIIGGGYTGLSAAIELARNGLKTVVLEAGPVGYGASGRNGGQVCTGYSPGMGKFERALGPDAARQAFDVAEEAKTLLVSRVQKYNIQCELTWGYVHGATRKGHVPELSTHRDELLRYGYGKTRLLELDEMRAKFGTQNFLAGLLDEGAGHLHPLNYCLGLARAAEAEGAVIHEHSAVTRIDDGAKVAVHTADGVVTARQVIMGCNAYLGNIAPTIASRVMPVASYMLATEPLGADRARSIIRDNEAGADSYFVIDYFRLSADHRLLYGGACSYSGIEPSDIKAFMRAKMLRMFPQLADVKIDYGWGGYIGITHNRLPDMNRVSKNVYYTQGYSGQGVVLSGMFGKMMAEAVMGDAGRFDLFSRIKHFPFPGGVLRRPALAVGMLYYRIRDLLA